MDRSISVFGKKKAAAGKDELPPNWNKGKDHGRAKDWLMP